MAQKAVQGNPDRAIKIFSKKTLRIAEAFYRHCSSKEEIYEEDLFLFDGFIMVL